MLALVSGLVAGIGLGVLRGGTPRGIARLELKSGWVFVAALLTEAFAALRLAPDPQVPLVLAGGLLLLSYVAILGAIWRNRHVPGLAVLGVGVLLNLLATLPHGGLMPVTAEVLSIAGRPVPDELPDSEARPYVVSKDIVLPRERIPLWVLSDRFAVPRGWPFAGVFSPGDIVVAAGLAWVLAGGMTRGSPVVVLGR